MGLNSQYLGIGVKWLFISPEEPTETRKTVYHTITAGSHFTMKGTTVVRVASITVAVITTVTATITVGSITTTTIRETSGIASVAITYSPRTTRTRDSRRHCTTAPDPTSSWYPG